jgi:Patatin-like phospholipase
MSTGVNTRAQHERVVRCAVIPAWIVWLGLATGCASRHCPPFPNHLDPIPVACGGCGANRAETEETFATPPFLKQYVEARERAAPHDDARAAAQKLGSPLANLGPGTDALSQLARALDEERILALSGGAQNGAFGAGFLWESHRARVLPDFGTVTGVSTGALQAPFVFVNSNEAFESMREGYLSAGVRDLIEMRPLVAVPFSTSLATANGLRRFVERYVTNRLIDQVAAQGALGRRLYVGTTNLDTGWLTVWDMVQIAKDRDYDRFRTILRASAHAPPIFPPLCIDGFLHMDGGVRQQLFVAGVLTAAERRIEKDQFPILKAMGKVKCDGALKDLRAALGKVHPRAYFVVNGYLGAQPACTQEDFLSIGLRSVDLLAEEALIGTLWKAYGQLQLYGPATDGSRFNLVSMPKEALIPDKSSMEYDRADMQRLFDCGVAVARRPEPWLHDPCQIPNLMHYEPVGASSP